MRRERLPRRIMRGRVGSGATLATGSCAQRTRAGRGPRYRRSGDRDADRDFVTESLETALCRSEVHWNSTLNIDTKGLSVASFEQAIGRSGVEVRDQTDRFLARTQHNGYADRIAWPGVRMPLGEADAEGQLLPTTEWERRLLRNVHYERMQNTLRAGLLQNGYGALAVTDQLIPFDRYPKACVAGPFK